MSMQPKIATGLVLWYMNLFGFKGVATFWGQIYVVQGFENDDRLLRHERMHLEQMKRDGWLRFHAKYSWYLIRFGYWRNPYEVEARAAESRE